MAHGCNAGANARRGLRKNAGSPGQKRNVQMMGARIREKGGIAFLTGGSFNAPGRGREPGAPREPFFMGTESVGDFFVFLGKASAGQSPGSRPRARPPEVKKRSARVRISRLGTTQPLGIRMVP